MIGKALVNMIVAGLIIYNNYNAYKARKYQNKELSRHYAYYFMVMCILLSFDLFFSPITAFFPFYQVIKLATVIWLSVPICSGSLFVYKFYLFKLFNRYEEGLDLFLEDVRTQVVDYVIHVYNLTSDKWTSFTQKKNDSVEVLTIEQPLISNNKQE
jgi:receptor expression-enhancing protein 1/2/3/4